jgi:hypothetical protein
LIFTFVFFALLVLAGVAFVASPIWRSRHFRALAREEERERLRREKGQALRLLRDLEFDYQTGKILEGDYTADRAEAERHAIELVKQLDENEKSHPADPHEAPAPAAARETPIPEKPLLSESDLEAPKPPRISISLEARDVRS